MEKGQGCGFAHKSALGDAEWGSLCPAPQQGRRKESAGRGPHLWGTHGGLAALQFPSPLVTPLQGFRGTVSLTLCSQKAQRGKASCPRSPIQETAKLRGEPKGIRPSNLGLLPSARQLPGGRFLGKETECNLEAGAPPLLGVT